MATAGFLVALLLGVFVLAINFYGLFILLLGWPLQMIYDRRAEVQSQGLTAGT